MLQILKSLIFFLGYAASAAIGSAQTPGGDDPAVTEPPTAAPSAETLESLPAPAPSTTPPADSAANPSDVPSPWGVMLDDIPATLRPHIASFLSNPRPTPKPSDSEWDDFFRGGPTVFAFGGQTENGSFSMQGSSDDVTLRADYRDRLGKRRQIRMQGAPRDLDAQFQQLPGDLREMIRGQMARPSDWDSWFAEDEPFDDEFPF